LEFSESIVAAVTRVDIEDDDTGDRAGSDGDIAVGMAGPPRFDLLGIERCVVNAVCGAWMFARVCAVGFAACAV
jgi:hypothetical protein